VGPIGWQGDGRGRAGVWGVVRVPLVQLEVFRPTPQNKDIQGLMRWELTEV